MVAESDELLEEVVQASGLSPLLAPFTVTRLLIKAGVNPKRLDGSGIAKALPVLESGLAAFLPPDEFDSAVTRLRRLAER